MLFAILNCLYCIYTVPLKTSLHHIRVRKRVLNSYFIIIYYIFCASSHMTYAHVSRVSFLSFLFHIFIVSVVYHSILHLKSAPGSYLWYTINLPGTGTHPWPRVLA